MSDAVDRGRRQLLTVATTLTGAVGVGFAAVPFLSSWQPSARAKALGAPVEIDISKLEPGAMLKIQWRGRPIYIVRRTPEMVRQLGKHDALLVDPQSRQSKQPEYTRNVARAINPEFFVVQGVCTHLGCAPMSRFEPADVELKTSSAGDWPGGFYCPCHGSKFDLSGRVFSGVPAPTNLEVPPYMFASSQQIVIGLDPPADA